MAVNEGGSPYNALSAFAGNPLLISPAELHLHGLLPEDAAAAPDLDDDGLDFPAALRWKEDVVRAAHALLADDEELRADLPRYREGRGGVAGRLRALPRPARRARRPLLGGVAGAAARTAIPTRWRRRGTSCSCEVDRHAYAQYLFDLQWSAVRRHAHEHGIRIVGDVPIFVAYDSADVWAHPELFELDEELRPTVVSGVPPDYFSSHRASAGGTRSTAGTCWRRPGYRWWIDRFRRTLEMVDVVRVDHFRGFESYWEVPADGGDGDARASGAPAPAARCSMPCAGSWAAFP